MKRLTMLLAGRPVKIVLIAVASSRADLSAARCS
jgi:hypothetical protein